MGEASEQIHRVVNLIKQKNGNKPVLLIAHSWGASTAIRYAGQFPDNVKGLVLFAPIVTRYPTLPNQTTTAGATEVKPPPAMPSVYPLSALSQYRRFIEDVPKGQPQVLNEVHFQKWATAYLAADASSMKRSPPSAVTPFGPVADIMQMWSGQNLYEPALVKSPVLLIRGAWDSLCNDADAARLIALLGSVEKTDIKIDRATHLLHFETERDKLYSAVNNFLERLAK
jgi:pimeloyl-ACP methyl ester carboxylesterase